MFKILIAGDDVDFGQLLREILKQHFPAIRIDNATSNKQAIKKTKQCSPQVIFMDINMLDGSSLPLVKKIKKAHPETIIVALTLYNIREYEEAAFQSGADYFLAKSSLSGNTIVKLIESIVPAIN